MQRDHNPHYPFTLVNAYSADDEMLYFTQVLNTFRSSYIFLHNLLFHFYKQKIYSRSVRYSVNIQKTYINDYIIVKYIYCENVKFLSTFQVSKHIFRYLISLQFCHHLSTATAVHSYEFIDLVTWGIDIMLSVLYQTYVVHNTVVFH